MRLILALKRITFYFVPVLKRTVSLLLRSHNRAKVEIHNPQEILTIVSANLIDLRIQSVNSLFIKVEGKYFPVYSDNVLIKLKLPIKVNQASIKIKAIGLFSYAKTQVSIHNIDVQFSSVKTPKLKDTFPLKWKEPFTIEVQSKEFKDVQNKLSVPHPNFELPDLEKTDH